MRLASKAMLSALVLAWFGISELTICATGAEPKNPSAPATASQSPTPRTGRSAIEAALDEKTSIDFTEVPLSDTIDFLNHKHGLEIQYDFFALKDATPPIDPATTPITRSAKDISLRSALRLALEDHCLTYIIKDEVLWITTKEVADKTLETRAYDITDLLRRDDSGTPDYQSFTELLEATFESSSWDHNGGLGTARGLGSGTLLVEQTSTVHEMIPAFLAALRQAMKQFGTSDVRATFVQETSEAARSIRKSLHEVTVCDFCETPLADVVAYVADKYKIPIQFDFPALKDATPPIDPTTTPITLKVRGPSLRSGLKMLLDPHGLTAIVKDEVLTITTKEVADKTLETRVYPVEDLVSHVRINGFSYDFLIPSPSDLADAISGTVSSASWANSGGLGWIEPYDKDGLVLVVSQTQEVHQQVADVLAQLRNLDQYHLGRNEAVEGLGSSELQGAKMTLRAYSLYVPERPGTSPTAQEVAEIVKSLVEPKIWSQGDAYIRGVSGTLMVRALPRVHLEIEKVLETMSLGKIDPSPTAKRRRPKWEINLGGMFGGGSGGQSDQSDHSAAQKAAQSPGSGS